ncbi:DUF421 domain-containing protein [Deinococcus aerolatus]|uniref:DUF421 domain-containing protein n=1 Tax=Deinococcus aerolatus TaxID=522487 RepID=A0ABQ2GBN5_9DEIO|nr:YetF domain-containing protein [Deinococcus aerolatus]GGL84291.1 DUF421 domain-containing protein [Deinococcus aerolatus]
MSGPEIIPFDWQRIWLGDAPPLFMLEIVFRTAVIFLWLLLLLRMTGKRGLTQLSALELVIVIALGSAAGDPLFYPEVPLLHAMLALALVVAFQRILTRLVVRSERVETFVEGVPVELVRDGVFDLSALHRSNLSRDDLFERLRVEGVAQLGEIRRAYFEQDGNLTIFRHSGDVPPGLAVVPPWDLEPPSVLDPDLPQQGLVACLDCGRVERVGGLLPGCACGGTSGWTAATTDPLAGPEGPARFADSA